MTAQSLLPFSDMTCLSFVKIFKRVKIEINTFQKLKVSSLWWGYIRLLKANAYLASHPYIISQVFSLNFLLN